jgi:hypothetical protein
VESFFLNYEVCKIGNKTIRAGAELTEQSKVFNLIGKGTGAVGLGLKGKSIYSDMQSGNYMDAISSVVSYVTYSIGTAVGAGTATTTAGVFRPH